MSYLLSLWKMIGNFSKFKNLMIDYSIKFMKNAFADVIQTYNFYYLSRNISFSENENQIIQQNIQNSKLIIVDQNEKLNNESNDKYLIIGFEKTIIILQQSSISFLCRILACNPSLSICFLSNTKEIVQQSTLIKIRNHEIKIDANFSEEIKSFTNDFILFNSNKIIKQIMKLIAPCISSYLIKKSYLKTTNYRIQQFLQDCEKETTKEIFNENEYVELRQIGTGSVFSSILIYHIKKCELYVIKIPYNKNSNISKLMQREEMNYSQKVMHPFLPKYYGKIQEKNYIVIEFINGETLKNYDKLKLTFDDKIKIIFEIAMIIYYFHENKLIYRDLKPDNVMIDENKTVVLIDFDRLIDNDINAIDQEHTLYFNSIFSDPEINYTGKFTYKSDIYSLGMIIKYLFKKDKLNYDDETQKIMNLAQKCTNEKSENRPDIIEMIEEFNSIIKTKVEIDLLRETCNCHFNYFKRINKIIQGLLIPLKKAKALYNLGFFFTGRYALYDINKALHYCTLAANHGYRRAQFSLGIVYERGQFVPRDISKAIYFYTLAANQNFGDAQYNLGVIYSNGKYFTPNIDKSIHYNSLAAKQNHLLALYNLACIYNNEKYSIHDINKTIHYLSLAANQNYPDAQYDLGVIYIIGKYVERDFNKAIHYFSLAANQNHREAQYNLGFLFSLSLHSKCDINKAIHYYSLAADQNHSNAQYELGLIYAKGEYVARDIIRAIHYFSLASNQNNLNAQYQLGLIYEQGKYVSRDINKAIHYYMLSAIPEAQYHLGFIYEEGKYVRRDIGKAIHYYTLSANQNLSETQYILGINYETGRYIAQDINKAIYYYTLASNQNHGKAQYRLGMIYYLGKYCPRDIKKGQYYIMLASKNNDKKAYFAHGFLLHEGKSVKRDIQGAIHYYKEASSFNNNFAKNNLGILYKNGILHELKARPASAIVYFEEAIRQKNDYIAMYNLAHLYIYDDTINHDINKSIELLLNSYIHFFHSMVLLNLVLMKQFHFDLVKIKQVIDQRLHANDLAKKIYVTLYYFSLQKQSFIENLYDYYQNIYFLYDIQFQPITPIQLEIMNEDDTIAKYPNAKEISSEFYEGFGMEI